MFEQSPLRKNNSEMHRDVLKATTLALFLNTLGLGSADSREHKKPGSYKETQQYEQPVDIDAIRQQVVHGDREFGYFRGDSNSYFQFRQGDSDRVGMSVPEVESFARAHGDQVIIAHTHPVSAYGYEDSGYIPSDIKEMQGDACEISFAPPSQEDLISVILIGTDLAEKNLTASGQVFDANGIWSYEVVDHEVTRSLREYRRQSKKVYEKVRKNPAVYPRLEGHDEDHHDFLFEPLLGQDIPDEIQDIAQAAINEINLISERYFFDWFGVISKVGKVQAKIISANALGLSREQIQELINQYVAAADAIGIKVTYKPYKKIQP